MLNTVRYEHVMSLFVTLVGYSTMCILECFGTSYVHRLTCDATDEHALASSLSCELLVVGMAVRILLENAMDGPNQPGRTIYFAVAMAALLLKCADAGLAIRQSSNGCCAPDNPVAKDREVVCCTVT